MIYNFDTDNENMATGALVVYAIYCSRDTKKFKVSPDMWGIIERGVKSSATRSTDLYDFMEKFKSKVSCSSIAPRHTNSHMQATEIMIPDGNGGFITKKETGKRAFWTDIIGEADNKEVIKELRNHTAYIITLVRERLEREKEIRSLTGAEESEETE